MNESDRSLVEILSDTSSSVEELARKMSDFQRDMHRLTMQLNDAPTHIIDEEPF